MKLHVQKGSNNLHLSKSYQIRSSSIARTHVVVVRTRYRALQLQYKPSPHSFLTLMIKLHHLVHSLKLNKIHRLSATQGKQTDIEDNRYLVIFILYYY